jgi:hypothetical protein
MTFDQQIQASRPLLIAGDKELIALESIYGKDHYKTVFIGQPLTILVEHFMNIAASRDTIENPLWWNDAFKGEMTDNEKAYYLESQYRHIKFFFFIKFFSVIESQFRILCRKMAPSALSEGRTDFKRVYEFIFTSLNFDNEYYQLFDFCRLNRNVIHNLGLHTSKSQIVYYKGKGYEFVKWQEVLMISPELQFVIHTDLFQAMVDIKNTQLFRDLPN